MLSNGKIAKLQDEQKQLEEQMAAHNPSDFVGLNEINMQVEAVRSHIDELEMEWPRKERDCRGIGQAFWLITSSVEEIFSATES